MEHQITNIERLVTSGKKVVTIEDLAVLWKIPERRKLIERIKYYLREKRLLHISKGVYAYGQDYTPLDIAQKLVPLSYISLYTASQMHGLTFQYYETIYAISLRSKTYTIDGQQYVYHKVKETIFYSQLGLIDNGRYIMADKERTICDCLYVFSSFYFDNLLGIDTEKLSLISKIYGNKRLEKEVNKLIKIIHAQK
jgi:predicted transcriptional regulator of viral defense system